MLTDLLKSRKNIKNNIIVGIIIILFFFFLYFFNKIEKVELINRTGTSYEKAIVVEIIEDNLQEDGTRIGYQKVKLKILSGNLKGNILDGTSFAGYLYGADCTIGMKVIASISEYDGNASVSVYSYDRSNIIYVFVGLFLLMLWIIGGKKGFKSAIGLMFTFICIIYLFLPMLYRGYSPFLSAVVVIILITIVSLYLIDGISKKSISAMIGTITGVIISGVCAAGFGNIAKISGYNVAEVEELVFISNNTNLKVGGILFAAILIASLGAVMDVSMSIASAMTEIYSHNNNIGKKDLFKSGINVGRDMMGTMSNTLILAFTGGSINTLILNYAYALKYNQVINMYQIGIEIMQGVSGSIAIILSVPLVSIISSYLLTFERKKYSKSEICYEDKI
ncbi:MULTISPECIES: YibE/F family protein [unclassified Clostridium]|uniref:YibE/F family protein n=1 Tax=unclassified Clostridium TaxID=2614128 RepID=UPI001C8B862B|nr:MULTISPECIES: YibE/F family protein [unclassified Clostridium]MBX9138287.1 YibE/F family protein [Clostridium sp. K12(2020)]MBX9145003.1 YibE/F family protein [Clostridium sp. K13]